METEIKNFHILRIIFIFIILVAIAFFAFKTTRPKIRASLQIPYYVKYGEENSNKCVNIQVIYKLNISYSGMSFRGNDIYVTWINESGELVIKDYLMREYSDIKNKLEVYQMSVLHSCVPKGNYTIVANINGILDGKSINTTTQTRFVVS